eukprot:712061-Rhodomonas_salina.2
MSGLKQPIVLPGSVASIKALELVENLARFANVRVLTTQKGAHFFDKDAIERTTGVQVFTDEDEWALWNGRGDPVQHIDLRQHHPTLTLLLCDAQSDIICAALSGDGPTSWLSHLSLQTRSRSLLRFALLSLFCVARRRFWASLRVGAVRWHVNSSCSTWVSTSRCSSACAMRGFRTRVVDCEKGDQNGIRTKVVTCGMGGQGLCDNLLTCTVRAW